MRHSSCERLSQKQVARLIARQKQLGLTRAALVERFAQTLKRSGAIHTPEAAKMRFDRVFNPRMRRPMSDSTKLALSGALDWSVNDFEKVLGRDGSSNNHSQPGLTGLLATLRADVQKLQQNLRKLESLIAKKPKLKS